MNSKYFLVSIIFLLLFASYAYAMDGYDQVYSKDTEIGHGVQVDWTVNTTDYSVNVFVLDINKADKKVKLEIVGSGKDIEDWVDEDGSSNVTFDNKSSIVAKVEYIVDNNTAQIKVYIPIGSKDVQLTDRTTDKAAVKKSANSDISIQLLENTPGRGSAIFVTDPLNHLLSGNAIVTGVSTQTQIPITISQGTGYFTIPIGETTITVQVMIPNYPTKVVTFKLKESPTYKLELWSSSVKINENSSISFTVKANDQPVENAAIDISGNGISKEIITDDSGSASTIITNPGNYTVKATKNGYTDSDELSITVSKIKNNITNKTEKTKLSIRFYNSDNMQIHESEKNKLVKINIMNGTNIADINTTATVSSQESSFKVPITDGVGSFTVGTGSYTVTIPKTDNYDQSSATIFAGTTVTTGYVVHTHSRLHKWLIVGLVAFILIVGYAKYGKRQKFYAGYGEVSDSDDEKESVVEEI